MKIYVKKWFWEQKSPGKHLFWTRVPSITLSYVFMFAHLTFVLKIQCLEATGVCIFMHVSLFLSYLHTYTSFVKWLNVSVSLFGLLHGPLSSPVFGKKSDKQNATTTAEFFDKIFTSCSWLCKPQDPCVWGSQSNRDYRLGHKKANFSGNSQWCSSLCKM